MFFRLMPFLILIDTRLSWPLAASRFFVPKFPYLFILLNQFQVDDLGLKVRAQSGPIKYRLVVREVPVNYTQEDVINMFKIEVHF